MSKKNKQTTSSPTPEEQKEDKVTLAQESETKETTNQDESSSEKSDKDEVTTEVKSDEASSNDQTTKTEQDSEENTEASAENKQQSNSASTSVNNTASSSAPRRKEIKNLANPNDDGPVNEPFKAKVIVVTSGKGGVGKTTTAAAISTGLALKGYKTAVIDFDVGLRNLDLIMGCERRVVYDFINVLHGEASLRQALITDRNTDNLSILAASQTKDKEALTYSGVGKVLLKLSEMGYDYIICDSPAGIETGALMALYYADEAIVTTNPEVSSVRDSDRIIGILNAKSRRAVNDWEPVRARLLLTRYIPQRVDMGEMLSINDVQELLTIPLLGVIPESPDVLKASNIGSTIILNQKSNAGQAYQDAVERLLGANIPLRFTKDERGFLQKLFNKS